MDIKSKLLSRPVDEGTIILEQSFLKFEECEALFEKWRWEGITACSVILLSTDVPLTNEKEFIEKLFQQMQLEVDKKLTTSRNGEFYFLNFNFSAD